ncbi:MAG: hypothetical protein ABIH04_09950 [Planctomycetota bacterium]
MGNRRIMTCPACPDRSGGAGIPKQPRTIAAAPVLIALASIAALALLLTPGSLRAENEAFNLTVVVLDKGNNPDGGGDVTGLSVKVTDIPERFLGGRATIDIWHQDDDASVMGRKEELSTYGDGTPVKSLEVPIPFPRPPNAGRWRVEVVIKKGTESISAERFLQINPSRRGVELDEMRKEREKVFDEIKKVRKEAENANKGWLQAGRTGENFDEQVWQREAEKRMQQLLKLRRNIKRDKMVNPFSRADTELFKAIEGLGEIGEALRNKLKGGKRVIEEITKGLPPEAVKEYIKSRGINPDAPDAMQQLINLKDKEIEERFVKAFQDFEKIYNKVSEALGDEIITGKHLAEDLAVLRGRVEELFDAYKACEEQFIPPPDGKKWMQDWMDGVTYFGKRTAERYKPSDRSGINNTHPEIEKRLPGLAVNMLALRDELLEELYERHNVPPGQREQVPASTVSDPFAKIMADYAQLEKIVEDERKTHVVPLIKVHKDFDALMAEIEKAKGVLPPGHAGRSNAILARAQSVFDHELFPYTVPSDVPRDIRGQHNRLYMLSLFSRAATEENRRKLEALKIQLETAEKALEEEEASNSASGAKVKELRKKVFEYRTKIGPLEASFRACEALIATFKKYGKSAAELLDMLLIVEPLPEKPELKDLETPDTETTRPE